MERQPSRPTVAAVPDTGRAARPPPPGDDEGHDATAASSSGGARFGDAEESASKNLEREFAGLAVADKATRTTPPSVEAPDESKLLETTFRMLKQSGLHVDLEKLKAVRPLLMTTEPADRVDVLRSCCTPVDADGVGR